MPGRKYLCRCAKKYNGRRKVVFYINPKGMEKENERRKTRGRKMKKRMLVLLVSACMLLNTANIAYASSVYEAEDAVTTQTKIVKPESAGEYSGTGYIEATNQDSKVEFTVTVQKAGNYAADIRYVNSKATEQPISIYVNGKFVRESLLPTTISADTYAVKTESLPLQAGENTILYQTSPKNIQGSDTIAIPNTSTGPLYWIGYETPFETDHFLSEQRWDKNVDWLSTEGFVDAGYNMMATDGWVEGGQEIDANGYITKYNYTWTKSWKDMGDQLKAKGIKLGVYYDPLWVTAAAFHSDATIEGTNIKVSSLINSDYGHFSDFKDANRPTSAEFSGKDWCQNGKPALYWLDTDQPGAEAYIKGYVKHFADAGAVFLRTDFLGWYENGIGGDGKQNGKPAYGTERYAKALKWMREACDQYGVTLSLVMPNQYDHAETELKYGHMMRVNEDVSNGGWDNETRGPEPGWPNDHLSGRRRGSWQPDWAQWGNTFDAFTGWADVGGRGQMILDGDFQRMARFDVIRTDSTTQRPVSGGEITVADAQKRSSVSLSAIAGAPICIADQYDTMNANAPAGVDNKEYYLNSEILALNKAGFVGKPMGLGQSERWAGQLPDGSWVVALFNRDRTTKTQSLDFNQDLGITGQASVRELWQHKELGTMSSYSVDLAACDCVVLKITPKTVRYEAEVGSLRSGANSNQNHENYSGWGFADKLEHQQGDVLIAVNTQGGNRSVSIRYCNGGTATAKGTLYVDGKKVQDIDLAPTGDWDTWGTLTVPNVNFNAGQSLVDVGCISDEGFNLDYIEIGDQGSAPGEKVHGTYEAEGAQLGSGARINNNHQLASDKRFVDSLDQPHWKGSNDTVKFTVNVKEAGFYNLSFRYANGGGDATADVFVNDKKLGYFTFPTVYPGAWDTWSEVTLFDAQKGGSDIELANVQLQQGANTVEYKHGNGGINLDCLTITKHDLSTAQQVADGAQNVAAPARDAAALTYPVMPSGYSASLVGSSNQAVVAADGTITPPLQDTPVTLRFLVKKWADGSTAETKEITVIVPGKTLLPHQVNLSDNLAGGTIAVNPASAVYGTPVQVQAVPSAGKRLKDGSLKVCTLSGGAIAMTDGRFIMPDEAVVLSAEFEDVPVTPTERYVISVDSGIQGGSVKVADGVTEAEAGMTVRLTVSPENGKKLESVYYNDHVAITSDAQGYYFTMPANAVTVYAVFSDQTAPIPQKYKITVGTAAGGKIVPAVTQAAAGETVLLQINPESGKRLKSGSLKAVTAKNQTVKIDGTTTYSFVMPAEDVALSGEFENNPAQSYYIRVANAEGGSVTASKASALAGEKVRLSVHFANGYRLALNGLAVKDAEDHVLAVDKNGYFTMPPSNVTVTARFELAGTIEDDPIPMKTGDMPRLEGYIAVMLVMAVVITGMIFWKRRRGGASE